MDVQRWELDEEQGPGTGIGESGSDRCVEFNEVVLLNGHLLRANWITGMGIFKH
jgi:hypothetical protein